jgi:hypothetical protein
MSTSIGRPRTAASFATVSPCTLGILDVKTHLVMQVEDPRRRAIVPIPTPLVAGRPRALPLPLEQLLHHYGCQDRHWDERGGANQPAGFCNPPSHIVGAQREAEKEAKKRAEHERRLGDEADLRAATTKTKQPEAAHERQLARWRKQGKEEEIDAEKEDARRRREMRELTPPW